MHLDVAPQIFDPALRGFVYELEGPGARFAVTFGGECSTFPVAALQLWLPDGKPLAVELRLARPKPGRVVCLLLTHAAAAVV